MGHASNVEVILLVFTIVVVVCLELRVCFFKDLSCVSILTSNTAVAAVPAAADVL